MKKWFYGIPAFLGVIAAIWGALTWLDIRPVLSRDFNDLATQVASNSQTLALQKWQFLKAKKENQGLTPSEQVEFCALSRQLGLKGEGCA